MAVNIITTRRPCSVARFKPSFLPPAQTDGRTNDSLMRTGLQHGFFGDAESVDEAGVLLGPNFADGSADGKFGSIILPSRALEMENGQIKDVNIKRWKATNKQGQEVDRFEVLFAEFRPHDGFPLVALPYQGEMAIYVDFYTGDFGEKQKTIVRALSGLHVHGAAAHPQYASTFLVEGGVAPKQKIADSKATLREGEAQQVGLERLGPTVNGNPIWRARKFRIEHDGKRDSQAVICVDQGRVFIVLAYNRRPGYFEITQEAEKKKHLEIFREQCAKEDAAKMAALPAAPEQGTLPFVATDEPAAEPATAA